MKKSIPVTADKTFDRGQLNNKFFSHRLTKVDDLTLSYGHVQLQLYRYISAVQEKGVYYGIGFQFFSRKSDIEEDLQALLEDFELMMRAMKA